MIMPIQSGPHCERRHKIGVGILKDLATLQNKGEIWVQNTNLRICQITTFGHHHFRPVQSAPNRERNPKIGVQILGKFPQKKCEIWVKTTELGICQKHSAHRICSESRGKTQNRGGHGRTFGTRGKKRRLLRQKLERKFGTLSKHHVRPKGLNLCTKQNFIDFFVAKVLS